jgi:hypothetical protein
MKNEMRSYDDAPKIWLKNFLSLKNFLRKIFVN